MSYEGFAARGEAYLVKGQPQLAIAECNQVCSLIMGEETNYFVKAIAANPNLAEAYHVRSLAYAAIGESNLSKQDSEVISLIFRRTYFLRKLFR